MISTYRYFFTVIIFIIFANCTLSQKVSPYVGSRIFWDVNSQTTVYTSGGYGRIIELQDGRLMAVCESGGIKASYSLNKGLSWTGERVIAPNPTNDINNAVPDVIQLRSGTILVCYNPRPKEPYTEDRKFGIRIRRSVSNGETWSNEIFVYDAKHTFTEGCWEPAILELPSGELQCYFANEGIYPSTSEQNISMCRSFDEGLTWSEPIIVSYRSGRRDGMPVPLLLEDKGEIVLIIEDNGIVYPNFRPVTIRTSIADNWFSGYVNGSSQNREMAFASPVLSSYNGGAPYIRRLLSGETILSYQGTEGRTSSDYADMFVMVGDDGARNFKAKSQPFNVAADKRVKWNSISVISSGEVLAVGSSNANSSGSQIISMRGKPLNKISAAFGEIKVDGQRTSDEKWTAPKAEQITMGTVTKTRWTADFLYDNKYLYFTSFLIDRDIINTLPNPDGVRLLIDAQDVCSSIPMNGTYNILFQTDGTMVLKEGNNGSWETVTNDVGIQFSVTIKSNYYMIEAAIPWSSLGYSNANNANRMAVAIERFDRSESTYQVEKIADALTNSPSTWMEFHLLDSISTSLSRRTLDKTMQIKFNGQQLVINAVDLIDTVKVFALDGHIIHSKSNILATRYELPIMSKVVLCSVILKNGQTACFKILSNNSLKI